MRLHHIGIVVPKIQNSIPEITKYIEFGNTDPIAFIESQKVNICFLKSGSIFLELIEPTGNDSPVTRFAEQGGGIHHLCFEVKNIHEKIDEMKKNGATVVVPLAKGFEGRLIAFLYLNMKNTKCNLIELVQEK